MSQSSFGKGENKSRCTLTKCGASRAIAVLRISGIASHFAPQIQANAMKQHFRIALIAMQKTHGLSLYHNTCVIVNAGNRRTAIVSRVITSPTSLASNVAPT